MLGELKAASTLLGRRTLEDSKTHWIEIKNAFAAEKCRPKLFFVACRVGRQRWQEKFWGRPQMESSNAANLTDLTKPAFDMFVAA